MSINGGEHPEGVTKNLDLAVIYRLSAEIEKEIQPKTTPFKDRGVEHYQLSLGTNSLRAEHNLFGARSVTCAQGATSTQGPH